MDQVASGKGEGVSLQTEKPWPRSPHLFKPMTVHVQGLGQAQHAPVTHAGGDLPALGWAWRRR